MTVNERLQSAYMGGRSSAALQICDHLLAVMTSMEDQDAVGAAALKYAAEFANSIADLQVKYEEEAR